MPSASLASTVEVAIPIYQLSVPPMPHLHLALLCWSSATVPLDIQVPMDLLVSCALLMTTALVASSPHAQPTALHHRGVPRYRTVSAMLASMLQMVSLLQ